MQYVTIKFTGAGVLHTQQANFNLPLIAKTAL
jgi:hypothetical protein